MVICPDCGKDVPKAKFCKNCGCRLPEIEEASVPIEMAETDSFIDIEVNDSQTVQNTANNRRFCHNCGYELAGEFKFCPNCGADLAGLSISRNAVVSSEKNIILAIVLSVILPGLGQIYLGLDRKGALFLIGYIVSAFLILILIGFLLCTVIWIWALVDTIQSTNAINRGEEVEDKLLN